MTDSRLALLLGIAATVLGTIALLVSVSAVGMAEDAAELPKVPPSTTSTSSVPWCDPATGDRVVPGAGIQEGHPECPQPPLRHAPPGTGPNTGPAGEPSS